MPRKTHGTSKSNQATQASDNRVLRLCKLLNAFRVKYIIAGGIAANLHGTLRSTKDVDVLVPKDRANTQRLLQALSTLPYGIAREIDVDDILGKPFTIIGDDPRVDVLTVAGKTTYEKAKTSKKVRTLFGVRVPYLGLAELIRSKSTGRLQDEADLEILKKLKK